MKCANLENVTGTAIEEFRTSCSVHPLCGFMIRMKVALTHPEVVHDLHGLLELYRNVHCDVVIEAGSHRELLRQRRPVVSPA